MPVNTKRVEGRRSVRYESFEEFWDDANSLASSEYKLLGNWSLAQILEHLSMTMNGSIDGFSMTMPAPVRWIMSLLMKRKFTEVAIPAGFPTSKEMVAAEELPLDDALADLRKAIDRQNETSERVMHPGFGKITTEEWTKFHLRHAEMHMSFVIPTESSPQPTESQSTEAAEV